VLTLSDLEAAALRIAPHVRRTPLLEVAVPSGPGRPDRVSLKLESHQVTGSFKARGATNKVLSLDGESRRGLVTASGGNHGLGVAFAGGIAGLPVTIYLPANVPPSKAEQLARWGARLVWQGEVWDDANAAALLAAERDELTYVHPFADPAVIAGQASVGLEILDQDPATDVVVVAIGGGGLASGVTLAIKAVKPACRVIGVEPTGAPTLFESLRAGRVVELPEVRTAANTLAPRCSHETNVAILARHLDRIVLVEDDEMRDAARWLWREAGVAAELSGAATLAAIQSGRLSLAPRDRVCAIVCGAGTAGLD
jgi:threonine dehydratase